MPAAPKRFDEDNLGFFLVEAGALVAATCFYLIARALRAVDDNLAPFDR